MSTRVSEEKIEKDGERERRLSVCIRVCIRVCVCVRESERVSVSFF